jgi:hypothetical protein
MRRPPGPTGKPASRRFFEKTLLADLLEIDDPADIGGSLLEVGPGEFNFPLQSV